MNTPESLDQQYLTVPIPAKVEEYKFDEPIDPIDVMLGAVPLMFERVKSSRHRAESYRNFLVVASAFAYDDKENRAGIITAGNFKAKIPEEDRDEVDLDSIPKVCAELDVTETASLNGFSKILGFVVAATNDKNLIKGVTGKATTTLHPCDECRSFMGANPMVDSQTLLFTTGFDRSVYQMQTVNGLLSQYNKTADNYTDPDIYKFNPLAWPTIQQKYREEVVRRGLTVGENGFNLNKFARYANIAKRVIRES